ncbi:MAG TPA: 3D domain-containing protein [Gemmatimonadaceae bacterium]|nr:3D domain-containing protein [Gemmatimonadaceae bacterium]
MKIRRISRRPLAPGIADDVSATKRRRVEVVRTIVAVTLAVALVGTGAIALPALAPAVSGIAVASPTAADVTARSGVEIPRRKGPQLEPDVLSDIEAIHDAPAKLAGPLAEKVSEIARALPSTAAKVAKATTAVTKPIASGVDVFPSTARILRATAHEAIKMKKGILPFVPSKFTRAENGITIPVSLTQYCVQGETRRGRQTRHGIVAADPRIFPLARYVEVFLGQEYLGRYLVDDTGGNVLGATLDIWNPDCKEAARFGRHWGSAVLVAREVEQTPNDSLIPTRWDGLAKR